MVAGFPRSVFGALHAFPLARGDRGVLEHVMMRGNDDGRAVLLDHALPPAERLAAHHAAGVSAKCASTDFLGRFVDVAHHQEKEIADSERISLPSPLDWKWTLRRVNMRKLSVFTGGVDPFAPPPGLRFIEATPVVIARQIVDVLTAVLLQYAELPDDLLAFRILRRTLLSRHIPQIQGDVPIETCCGFGLSNRFSQTLSAVFLVSAHVRICEHPNAERLRRFGTPFRGFGGVLR